MSHASACMRRRCIGRAAHIAAALVLVTSLSGCVVLGSGDSGGWQLQTGSVTGDWRELNMQNLMAYSDTWFVVDTQQRGTVKGFPAGGVMAASDGGFFEISVISRQNDVPVQQIVRVYYDQWTPVYVAGERRGTVLEGLTADGFNVVRGGRMLGVPFHINGGRLFAERVNVLEEPAPEVR